MSSSAFQFKHMRYLDLSYSNLEDVHAESIHQLYNLQTLNLSCSQNVQKVLKQGIGSLIKLRYLDLSSSDVKLLPDSIKRLTNLQILNINSCRYISVLPDSICLLRNLTKFNFSSCWKLKALPRNFGALTQLRSLDLTGTHITELPESLTSNICKLEFVHLGDRCKFPGDIKNWVELRHLKYDGTRDGMIMPRGIENLTRLQVLRPYIVRKEDDVSSYNSTSSSSIYQLAHLNSLCMLVILNLDNVRGGKIEAETAKLKDKRNIRYLYLHWDFKEEEDQVVVHNSAMVLEGLQPHPNLETLDIVGFPGLTLPKWMGSSSCLHNLVRLKFENCNNCTKFESLGQLPCLEDLVLQKMASVKCLGNEFYYQQQEEDEIKDSATTRRTLFPWLTQLSIWELENLEEWLAPDNSFPCLERVHIFDCVDLRCIPDFRLWTSSLTELTIRNCKILEKELKAYDLDKLLPSVTIHVSSDDDS